MNLKNARPFLPLLALYTLLILVLSPEAVDHDEWRYLMYAENILDGYYTDRSDPNLMNGPGYPAFLAIFLGLNFPPIVTKLANGALMFLAVVYLFEVLRFFISKTRAIVFAYGLGLYVPALIWMPLRITDCLSLFLICAVMCYIVRTLRAASWPVKDIIIGSLLLAWLILTKLFFGMLVLAFLFLAAVHYLFSRRSASLRYVMMLGLGWLVGAVPYLIYTHSLTGRWGYWSTNGGEQLYWMSSHLDREYGNWLTPDYVMLRKIDGIDASHLEFFDMAYGKVECLPPVYLGDNCRPHVERNDLFIATAKERIRANPRGYLYNYAASAVRLALGYPYSYRSQTLSTIPYLVFQLFYLVPLALSVIPAWRNRDSIPFEVRSLCSFTPLYWMIICLLTGTPRHFIPLVPFILVWLGFVCTRFVQISLEEHPNDAG